MSTPKSLPTAATMADAMSWAGDFVTGLMSDWPEFPFSYGGEDADHPNIFPQADATGADAKRGRSAAYMYWESGPTRR